MKKKSSILLSAITVALSAVGFTSFNPQVANAQEPVVIDWWTPQWSDQETAWIEKYVEEFNNSQAEIQVALEVVPGDAWDQRIIAAQAAGNAPDITTMNYNKIVFSAERGEILPLNDYMDPAVFDDLLDNVKGFVTVGDQQYAYPMLVEPSSVLFYRKDLFEEAGLDPEVAPTTWEELKSFGEQLKGVGNTVSPLAAANNAVEIAWTHWGLQAMVDGYPINDDWSASTINSPQVAELVEFWASLHTDGILPVQGFETGYNDITPLADGAVAMQISGSWVIGQLKNEHPEVVENIGVAVMPTPDGNFDRPTASLGGWTLTIDGLSDNPQEAADFISWFVAGDEEIMLEFFRDTAQYSKFPARISVDEVISTDPAGAEDPWRQLIAEQIIPYAVPEPIYAWEISQEYANAVERVYITGQSVEDALIEAETNINTYIENNDYAGTNPRQ
ncbi:extracellular solute-binding protein [Fundicoccus culcitae]|uniref:Extracellular solute-binding protein n=1 Tax=Fundicoccus culcitae TaxID=2969821 RepID=A0ABY5P5D9_9LACT|nr:extracellular solute-binding protein [Fundicoccus culcitae]UUX33764.1 extracellular solute-binding protein [Fundicoccus culcitae]